MLTKKIILFIKKIEFLSYIIAYKIFDIEKKTIKAIFE